MLSFREITIEDKARVEKCASAYNYHLCEHCFTDLYIWRGHYQTRICFLENFLLVRMQTLDEQKIMYLAPIGTGNLSRAIQLIEQDAQDNGVPFIMTSIAEAMIPRIEEILPGYFNYNANEDGADYIYLSEKLQTLSGKKLQSKRNLINRFLSMYEARWSYEDITEQNRHEVFQFHISWCQQNGCLKDQSFWGETCAIGIALNYFDQLDLCGGVLRLDGDIIAFTFGSQATEDMFVVQIEKADHEIPGAYQMINQQFVLHNCLGVKYINREEDLGLEGLRKAKRSYHPEMMGVKYWATKK